MAWRTHKLWRCSKCGHLTHDLPRSNHPPLLGAYIFDCPRCSEANTVDRVCAFDGCAEPATCGTSTPDGYRRTCSKHLVEQ